MANNETVIHMQGSKLESLNYGSGSMTPGYFKLIEDYFAEKLMEKLLGGAWPVMGNSVAIQKISTQVKMRKVMDR